MKVRTLPEEQSARGMLKMLAGEQPTTMRFLFPCGDLAGEDLVKGLEEQGALVECVVVYRTAPPDEAAAMELRTRVFKRQIDVVAFFSPSAVRNFVRLCDSEMLHRLLESARCAAIGPTTGDAMIRAGLRVDIRGERPSAESLAQAIEECFESTLGDGR
jgi:uroporphyrinogen-III synthase